MTIKLRRNSSPGPAEAQTPKASSPAPTEARTAKADSELVAQRDRLTERFALMQSELGGLFYEMAIRDHVQMDILTDRAAELQRLDGELGAVERLLESGAHSIGGHCPQCGAIYAPGAAFCAQCANPLTAP